MSRVAIVRVVLTVACLAGAGCVMDTGGGDEGSTSESLRSVCHKGAACLPANPCKNGAFSCVGHSQVCVETTNKATGTVCGAGLVCNANGICAACAAGAACTPTNPCHTGAFSCATGAPICLDTGIKVAGTSCGAGLVCNANGICAACATGQSCDICRSGAISCSSGAPVCVFGANQPAGTPCGGGLVCNGAGTCG